MNPLKGFWIMENQFLEINGLQKIKGDSVEAYIRSIDLLLAQQDRRLRVATATIQQQEHQIKALQRRLATAEDSLVAVAAAQREERPADVVDVDALPAVEE